MNLLHRASRIMAVRLIRPILQRLGCGYLSSVALEHIDLQLIEILGRKRNGFFIEAGANDGVLQSNTYYMEKVLNWSGILIEPLPGKVTLCRRNRPRAHVINSALVSNDFHGSKVTIDPANLMTVVKDHGQNSTWAEEHSELGRKIQNLPKEPPIEVPAVTLSKVLNDRQIKRVDFFSLDVEGYELEVLRGIDFATCHFQWIFIETRPDNEQQIDHLLQQHGFSWKRTWQNEDYSNKLYHSEAKASF